MKRFRMTGAYRGLGEWLVSLLLLGLVACGSDTSVSIRFSSGTITDNAQCSGGGGNFPLEQQNGLVVIVIVTDDTTIVHASSGKPARCADLTEGTRASVQGRDENGGIRADQVDILSS
jgi:hypothetical protein